MIYNLPLETPFLTRRLAGAIAGLLKHFEGPQSLAAQSDLNSNCYMSEVYDAIDALKSIQGFERVKGVYNIPEREEF